MVRTSNVALFFVLLLLLLCPAAPSQAQSPYVAGAIGADLSRVSHAESSVYQSASGNDEVLSGALRVGASVGANWGVELEYVRSGKSHDEIPLVYPLATATPGTSVSIAFPGLPPGITDALSIAIPIAFQSEVTRRHSAFDTVAWVRQAVGGSVDLVYLAGVAFDRNRSDVSQSVVARGALPPTPLRSSFVQYGTHPIVGMEARIGLASKLRLVPGLRGQSLTEGWLVRPEVSLGWFF